MQHKSARLCARYCGAHMQQERREPKGVFLGGSQEQLPSMLLQPPLPPEPLPATATSAPAYPKNRRRQHHCPQKQESQRARASLPPGSLPRPALLLQDSLLTGLGEVHLSALQSRQGSTESTIY